MLGFEAFSAWQVSECLAGGDLKKTRKFEVRIEHEELTMFVDKLPGTSSAQGSETNVQALTEAWLRSAAARGSGLRHIKPENCPTCGKAELHLLSEAVTMGAFTAAGLQLGVKSGGYHLHCSATGEWWVCGITPH
jgi:hypothetical protein